MLDEQTDKDVSRKNLPILTNEITIERDNFCYSVFYFYFYMQ